MMNMKKMLALLLAVVMVLGMIPFGAMAEEAEPVTHIETCLEGCVLEDCACTCHAAPETPAEEPKQEQPPVGPASLDDTQTQETPVCTCTPVEGVHAEGCALYVKPEAPVEEPKTEETPVCTCTPAEDGTHAEGCALYVKPEVPVVPEEEVVSVDYAALYESIMSCDDLFAADALVDALSEEEQAAFEATLTEEQSTALDAHYAALIAAYEAKVPTELVLEEETAEEDTREIVYVTKDMTNAAPFQPPVEGPAKRLMRLFSAAPVADEGENGLILDKSVSGPNANGEYTITLEAYATGEKTTIKQELNVPTDIVLVLDQSGSMDESFDSIAYRTTSGTPDELYNDRNNLYVKLSDGSYSPVSVGRAYATTATTYSEFFNQTNSTYYNSDNRNRLYHKCDDDTYGKINVNRGGYSGNRNYTYTCVNCGRLGNTSYGADTRPNYSASFYLAETQYVYQYTFSYKKEDGTTETKVVLATENAPNWDFYESYASGSTTKLAALKNAVTTFANEVAKKAKGADGVLDTEDDVDHTISVVGFASGYAYTYNDGWFGQETDYYYYENTELFVGNDTYTYNAGSQNSANNANAAQQHYDEAPQDMSTAEGVANVTASINALDGNGGTIINLGMELANGILDANPVPSGEKRNRVVIVFTDGTPGWSGYDSDVADDAIDEADEAKNTHKATVYTVGIFSGADASSAGNSNGTNTQKANWFMQNLSSNEGTVQNPSYYLSASDSAALNTIFKTISEEIENGGSSIELEGDTVVKDIIADSFKLPDGANTNSIKVYTDSVDPATGDFKDTPEAFNATVTISGKDISVTDFNFKENWVGAEKDVNGNPTYRGKKLIIEIPIVPNLYFLGGNNVPTNGSASGVYNDGELVENFPGPDTDVELKILEIGLATTDQNIYLSNDADLAALVTSLDQRINGTNNAYVDVKYEIKDGGTVIGTVTIPAGSALPSEIVWTEAAGQDMTPNLDAVDTKNYTIVATASPTSTGTYTATENIKTEPVNVFKPVVYFQDSEINAGATPVYAEQNLVKVEWKDVNNTLASTVTMHGTEPQLVYTYNPVAAPLNAESEVQITAVATTAQKTINLNHITFIRNACNLTNGCGHPGSTVDMSEEGYVNFIVHLNTFNLKIVKEGWNSMESGQSYLFTIAAKDEGNTLNLDVMIYQNGSVTIKGIPVGKYDLTEDTNWSWRYDPKGGATKTITAKMISEGIDDNGTYTVIFENVRNEIYWLDGNHFVDNVFGVAG